eukprot:EG_transcript_34203
MSSIRTISTIKNLKGIEKRKKLGYFFHYHQNEVSALLYSLYHESDYNYGFTYTFQNVEGRMHVTSSLLQQMNTTLGRTHSLFTPGFHWSYYWVHPIPCYIVLPGAQ